MKGSHYARIADIRDDLMPATEACLTRAYESGFRQGLAVAETIAAWLTRQPDTPEQAEVRKWAENAIAKAREEMGL